MGKKVPRPPKFRQKNGAGAWEAVDRKTFNRELGRAHSHIGEQNLGFYLNDAGFWIIEGPSGAGGHGIDGHGFDGVAFNPTTKEIIIYDNKALDRAGVKDAEALEKHLKQNLEEIIEKIEARKASGEAIPHSDFLLKNFREALQSAGKRGAEWPKAVKLYIFGVSGRARKLTPKFAKLIKKRGLPIEFKSWEDLKKVRTPGIASGEARKEVNRLTGFVIKEEKKAAPAIIKRVEKFVVAKGKKRVIAFIEKRMPKLIAESVLKGSAKAAAHRASSLVPLVGWAFDAQDAYKGVEDIFRGHVARGLSGVTLSIADVGADFLHLGDAVSGVGGTALSIGAQVGIMAGQVKIEMDRKEEKLKELAKEVEDLGGLPPDDRLRNEYDLDDEEIADFKREFAMDESAPEPEPELPELPPDISLPPPEISPLDEPPPDDPDLDPPPKPRNNVGDSPAPPKPRNNVGDAPDGGQRLRDENDRVPRWVDQPIA